MEQVHQQRRRLITGMVTLALVVGGALSGVGVQPVAAQRGYTPEIAWYPCPFVIPDGEVEGQTVECGYLSVPQDRSKVNGPWIDLAFAILYANGAGSVMADPVLYLEGGPGGSALSTVEVWGDIPFRAERDIVLLDQRGTGYSYPRLYCWEWEDVEYDSAWSERELDEIDAAALKECRLRLADEDDVDLTQYNSAASAADVRDLRVALGYPMVNLYGISYGTRLALTVLRDYPDGVRSVVLDSTYPPEVDKYEELAVTAYRSFQLLFAACAADPDCAATYPDLETRFYALVDRLDDKPITLLEDEGTMSGDDLVNFIFDLFYVADTIPYMPLLIYELELGETALLMDLYDWWYYGREAGDPIMDFLDELFVALDTLDDNTYDDFENALLDLETLTYEGLSNAINSTFDDEGAETLLDLLDAIPTSDYPDLEAELFWGNVADTNGVFDAVECFEEVPFNDYEEAVALAVNIPPQIAEPMLFGLEAQQFSCKHWPTGQASDIEDQPVTSSVPVLVLGGEFDPITPPEWGDQTAATLTHAASFTFPGVGHGVIDAGECPMGMIVAFLENPDQMPDGSCIAAMEGLPPFELP